MGQENKGLEQSNKAKSKQKPKSRFSKIAREIAAILFWLYFLVTLFWFDVVGAIAAAIGSPATKLVQYKPFIFVMLFAIMLIFWRRFRIWQFIIYIVSYPVIVCVTRIIPLLYREWAFLVVFAPAVYNTARNYRRKCLFAVALISAIIALQVFSHPAILLIATVTAALLVVVVLVESLVSAYSANVFASLTEHVKRLRGMIAQGTFDSTLKSSEDKALVKGEKKSSPYLATYCFSNFATLIGTRLNSVLRGKFIDHYLLASWVVLAAKIVLLYTFIYLGLFKLSPEAFKYSGSEAAPSLTSLFIYSLSAFSHISGTEVIANSRICVLVSHSEGVATWLLGIVVVFTLFTTTRERFNRDIEEFASELLLTSHAIENRCFALCALKMDQIERLVFEVDAKTVNYFRKQLNLPELTVTSDGETKKHFKEGESISGSEQDPENPQNKDDLGDHLY